MEFLRRDVVGGALLVIAAVVALVWANSPWAEHYFTLRDVSVGFESLHLNLTLLHWAADGLLAVFFFLVGLELKREFVAGDLRHFRSAIVPVAAAAGGVIVPALIYTTIVWQEPGLRQGWAIPTATDIAFAVAVLALIGSHLPGALRIFLLTLAVVDDLIAISIIAIFYTAAVEFLPLLLALATIAVYGLIVQRYREFFAARAWAAWLILLPLGIVAWAFMHASGIHATIAGVLLGFMVPVLHRRGTGVPKGEAAGVSIGSPVSPADEGPGLAEQFEHRFRPVSAGLAVPIFAFFSAGVAIGGMTGLTSALTAPVAIAIIAALVVGKPVGVLTTTYLLGRFTHVRIDPVLRKRDLAGIGLLAGIGFTVSLLVAELSFVTGSSEHDQATVGILTASVIAGVLATCVLLPSNREYARRERQDKPVPEVQVKDEA